MKKIRNYWEDVCRVECMVCDDDRDYIDFLRHKKYDSTDKEDYIYYLKFVDKNDWDLSMRFKKAWDIFKNLKSFKEGKKRIYQGLMFTFDQCWELNSALMENAQEYGILENEDIERINSFNEFKSIIKYPIHFVDGTINNDSNDEIIMLSEDNLVLTMETALVEKELLIHDFSLGWSIHKETTKWEALKMGLNFIFHADRKNQIQENEGFFYKEDLIKFLSITNFIFNHIEQTKDKNIFKLPE